MSDPAGGTGTSVATGVTGPTVRRAGSVLAVLVVLAAVVTAAIVDHDWGRPSVATAERMLVERYLEPLRAAGIAYEVDRTCHYRTHLDDEPWHLEVQITAAASGQQVADVLAGTIDVIRPDGPGSWHVQDVRNDPQGGWNAGLDEAAPDRTLLSGVFNNVDPDLDANVGWQATCAFPL